MRNFICGLGQVGMADIETVGGKNASLGEMIQHLSPLGVNVPGGFVITVDAYRYFIEAGGLDERIRQLVGKIDFTSIESLQRGGLEIRQLIRNSKFPKDLSEAIISAYFELSGKYQLSNTDVAVRSSATAEDLPDASFAGQQETYLNVRGAAELMDNVRNCFASLFTNRAISYRHSFNYDHFSIGLSVGVQKMVRSDLATSGVAFSLDTESGFKDVVVISAAYGLGEMVVQGAVSPDEYMVFKPALKSGFAAIIEKKLGDKAEKMVYADGPDERVKKILVSNNDKNRFCLDDRHILQLAEWVVKIEDYYSGLKNAWCPMDIEWAVDGQTGELFIVQARPETIHSRKKNTVINEYRIDAKTEPVLKGIAVGDKIAAGRVNIVHSMDTRQGAEFRAGDILVTDMTDPDWEPLMKMAAAIITNKGGRTCHAAIVAREMGVPAIVGCVNATQRLRQDAMITANCADGDEGLIYEGKLDFELIRTELSELPAIRTPLMLNVGAPSSAFLHAALPNKGVGLAREEFIINSYIKVHPLALLNHAAIGDEDLSTQIRELMRGFSSEKEYFIDRLSYGIGRIAAAFYPNKVIVRFSDFKSNEYFNLLGGQYFEPVEENPMIGWRGASRYYSERFKPAFALECQAIKKVREIMGLDNVIVMIPFCRTVEELLKVQGVMKEFGLERGKKGLELYLMAELPSNIMLADQFAQHIDGFSIGSNDLTQLTLGLDRDSVLVASLYDERNPAVKAMIAMLIRTAKKAGVKVGICGQGPSDFPDFTRFLIEEGIDSISVTPDALLKTMRVIADAESEQSFHRRDPPIVEPREELVGS